MKPLFFVSAIVLAAVASGFAAESGLEWDETVSSLALMRGTNTVWRFNFKKEEGKPYFHPVTLAGSSSLTDLRPADHYWHRALWFSWKSLNGVNYWEEDPKTGKSQGQVEIVNAETTVRPNFSAGIKLDIIYHPPNKPAILREICVIEVGPPTSSGAYSIDWTSTFTAADADVLFDRTPILGEPNGVSWGGYAGLSLRLAPALKQWHFADSEGVVKGSSKQARWMSFSGLLENANPATILVLEHPASFRHPTTWYLINDMPYFSPAVLYKSPYTLKAKQSFTLKYRVVLQPAAFDRQAAEKEWQALAAGR